VTAPVPWPHEGTHGPCNGCGMARASYPYFGCDCTCDFGSCIICGTPYRDEEAQSFGHCGECAKDDGQVAQEGAR
jgi:hypothetical protein